MAQVTFDQIKNNEEIKTYIKIGNDVLGVMGYTEHSFAHAMRTATVAGKLLTDLGYSPREIELAMIAGYMHDIGNIVNRIDHAQSGALIAYNMLERMNMDPIEIAEILGAIGNHDEGTGRPVNTISAALILADKSDVRRSRVRAADEIKADIHDRVNYAAYKSQIYISEDKKRSIIELDIDTSICAVMEYFEIFLTRMVMCRKASEFLKIKFQLIINGTEFL